MSHASQHPNSKCCSGNQPTRALWIALTLTCIFTLVEFAGGWLTNSLALMTDAGHMLTDAAALGLSLFALRFATRPATAQKTYGFQRVEILAALVNGVTLVLISLVIFYEAYERIFSPPLVKSGPMLAGRLRRTPYQPRLCFRSPRVAFNQLKRPGGTPARDRRCFGFRRSDCRWNPDAGQGMVRS
jgi:hypothetical protein